MTDQPTTPAQVAVKPLLPCPFCGTTEMLRHIGANPGDGWGFVRCDYCDAEGPDPENLAGGWNARAAPAPAEQDPVAWQYRYRPTGTDEWSDWADGKMPDFRGASYEAQERPLYTLPAQVAEAELDEAELDEAWKSGFNAGFGEAMLTAPVPAVPDPWHVMKEGDGARCEDCLLPYSDAGFQDLCVSDEDFAKISRHGNGDGLFCPSCMCRRAHDAGLECQAVFRSGPFCDRSGLPSNAAPAVPDDVPETAKRLRQATFTKGRMRGGVGGQTIEASMRSTFHEVSAWDLDVAADALEAQAAELARLTDANDTLGGHLATALSRAMKAEAEVAHLTEELARLKEAADNLVNHPGWGTVNYTDGDMWADADKLRAALNPTGD